MREANLDKSQRAGSHLDLSQSVSFSGAVKRGVEIEMAHFDPSSGVYQTGGDRREFVLWYPRTVNRTQKLITIDHVVWVQLKPYWSDVTRLEWVDNRDNVEFYLSRELAELHKDKYEHPNSIGWRVGWPVQYLLAFDANKKQIDAKQFFLHRPYNGLAY